MTSYLLKEHRYVQTDDLSTPKVFRSMPARQQRKNAHIVGKRCMRRGETRITQGQGDIYRSRRFKIQDCFFEYFSEQDGKFAAIIQPKIDNDAIVVVCFDN